MPALPIRRICEPDGGAGAGRRPGDHPAHRPTTGPAGWSLSRARAPVPACRPRGPCGRSRHGDGRRRPGGATGRRLHPPGRPRSNGATPRRHVDKFRIGGTAAGDRRTSRPRRAPATPDRPSLGRGAEPARGLARSGRSARTPAWAGPVGSPGSGKGRTPAFRRRLRPAV